MIIKHYKPLLCSLQVISQKYKFIKIVLVLSHFSFGLKYFLLLKITLQI
jgi:hypothetical protein